MQFSRGLQIEKSLLAPTFYTDWLDRAMKRFLYMKQKQRLNNQPIINAMKMGVHFILTIVSVVAYGT